jgi:hypothetical protein
MKFSNLKLVTFFTALFFVTFDCFSSIIDDETAVAFAGFIQDIVHTTQTSKHGPICGIGSDEISKIIASQDKTFIDLDLEPKKYEQCKAVYIAQGREKSLRVEIEKLNKKKILTIAIFDGFTEIGGMLQVQMGRRNFELTLNSKVAKESGIRLNALSTSLIIN